MVADLRNALYPSLVEPLHDRFAEHGLRMVLLAERGDDRRTYERLLDRSVDGVVLTTTLLGSSCRRICWNGAALRRAEPAFRAGARWTASPPTTPAARPRSAGCCWRRPSQDRGGVRHAGGQHQPGSRSRFPHRQSDEAGVELPRAGSLRGGFGYEDGERGFAQLMSGRSEPTAVFCFGDLVAVGALNQARRMGLSVPDDVAIVGFDDIEMASWPCFELTTARIDLRGWRSRPPTCWFPGSVATEAPRRSEPFPAELVLRRPTRSRFSRPFLGLDPG